MRRDIHRVRGGRLVYEEAKTRRSQRTPALPLSLDAQLPDCRAAKLALGENLLPASRGVARHSQKGTTMDIDSQVMRAPADGAADQASTLQLPRGPITRHQERRRPPSGWRTAWSIGWS